MKNTQTVAFLIGCCFLTMAAAQPVRRPAVRYAAPIPQRTIPQGGVPQQTITRPQGSVPQQTITRPQGSVPQHSITRPQGNVPQQTITVPQRTIQRSDSQAQSQNGSGK
jgi:hypothetical protein